MMNAYLVILSCLDCMFVVCLSDTLVLCGMWHNAKVLTGGICDVDGLGLIGRHLIWYQVL